LYMFLEEVLVYEKTKVFQNNNNNNNKNQKWKEESNKTSKHQKQQQDNFLIKWPGFAISSFMEPSLIIQTVYDFSHGPVHKTIGTV
jgi:hypothetical protein